MDTDEFAERVSGVAALADPIRRALYLYVAAAAAPVSRDEASGAVRIPRPTAKFHLDKLVEHGLLDTEFRRISGRRGPGAGRPAKLYKRSTRQLAVSLPERRYDVAGMLMARAIDESGRDGTDVVHHLHRVAAEVGTGLADRARVAAGRAPTDDRMLASMGAVLSEWGFEPQFGAEVVTLANCPFDALAREHTALVCGMNLALLDAAARHSGLPATARLDPGDGRCCVVLDIGPTAGPKVPAPAGE